MDLPDAAQVVLPLVVFALAVTLLLRCWPRPPRTFLTRERQSAELIDVVPLSHDTKRLRLSLGNKDTVLGLPVGKHLIVYAPNPASCLMSGRWNGQDDPDRGRPEVERKYTPITGDECPGYVDLIIKVYRPGAARQPQPDGSKTKWEDGGKVSLFLDSKQPGDYIDFRGPMGVHEYLGRGLFKTPGRTVARLLDFRFVDVLCVLLFLLQLFYISVLKNAVLPLTCSPSPNGHLTLNKYPHIVCWDWEHDASFWPLALVGGVFTVILIVAYPLLLFCLMRRLPEFQDEVSVQETQTGGQDEDGSSARWWEFVFDDYRPDCRRFVLVIVGKDIFLNLIAVVLPGLGTYQLLLIAMVSSGYAFHVKITMPFHDTSNTLLEAWTSAAVAVLCIFSAGMGFQSEAEVLDISSYLENGRSNPAYIQRVIVLVCLQTLSIFATGAIITFQMLAAFERTRRFLPRTWLPATEEQLQAWRRDAHVAAAQLDHVALTALHSVLKSSVAARRSLQQGKGEGGEGAAACEGEGEGEGEGEEIAVPGEADGLGLGLEDGAAGEDERASSLRSIFPQTNSQQPAATRRRAASSCLALGRCLNLGP